MRSNVIWVTYVCSKVIKFQSICSELTEAKHMHSSVTYNCFSNIKVNEKTCFLILSNLQ